MSHSFHPAAWRLIAQAEAQAHARYARWGAGGVFGPLQAVQAGPGQPINSAWHDGTRAPTEAEWLAFEEFCAVQAQGAAVQMVVQVLSPAVTELLPQLGARGYALSYVLHLYTRDLLTRLLPTTHDAGGPQRDAAVIQEANADAWAALAAQGFGGGQDIMRLVAHTPGTRLFSAYLDGQPVASAALTITNRVAALHGTATLPAFRGRGLQQALLSHRLQVAQQAGANLATVFVTPGSGSERNVARAGLTLAGMRLTFSRQHALP